MVIQRFRQKLSIVNTSDEDTDEHHNTAGKDYIVYHRTRQFYIAETNDSHARDIKDQI